MREENYVCEFSMEMKMGSRYRCIAAQASRGAVIMQYRISVYLGTP